MSINIWSQAPDACGCSFREGGDQNPNYLTVPVAGLGTPQSQVAGNVFIYNTTGGAINQPLPPVASQFPGTKYKFWKSSADGNAVNLVPYTNPVTMVTDTFLGLPNVNLTVQGAGVELIADTILLVWRAVSL